MNWGSNNHGLRSSLVNRSRILDAAPSIRFLYSIHGTRADSRPGGRWSQRPLPPRSSSTPPDEWPPGGRTFGRRVASVDSANPIAPWNGRVRTTGTPDEPHTEPLIRVGRETSASRTKPSRSPSSPPSATEPTRRWGRDETPVASTRCAVRPLLSESKGLGTSRSRSEHCLGIRSCSRDLRTARMDGERRPAASTPQPGTDVSTVARMR